VVNVVVDDDDLSAGDEDAEVVSYDDLPPDQESDGVYYSP